MENICVSKCLLGDACRYDGKSVPSSDVIKLKEKYNIIPVCPECMGGLSTPRNPSEIVGDKVISNVGFDNTSFFEKGAMEALRAYQDNKCIFAILKEKSPSCGSNYIYDGTFTGTLIKGKGICTRLFEKNGIIVFSENNFNEGLK